jgi:hypothetical protein
MDEAKRIGEDYLALEKYVNLNYMVGRRAGGPRLARGRLDALRGRAAAGAGDAGWGI